MKRMNDLFDHLIDTLVVIAGIFIMLMMLLSATRSFQGIFLNQPYGSVEFCEYMLFLLCLSRVPLGS
jgi:hypothetical protein